MKTRTKKQPPPKTLTWVKNISAIWGTSRKKGCHGLPPIFQILTILAIHGVKITKNQTPVTCFV